MRSTTKVMNKGPNNNLEIKNTISKQQQQQFDRLSISIIDLISRRNNKQTEI